MELPAESVRQQMYGEKSNSVIDNALIVLPWKTLFPTNDRTDVEYGKKLDQKQSGG